MANVMAVCILNRLLLNGLAVFRSSKTCHAGGSYYKLITCGTAVVLHVAIRVCSLYIT